MSGPFPFGPLPDLRIFKNRLVETLLPDEMVVADNGYSHPKCITLNSVSDGQRKFFSRVRARHETCSARLKSFNTQKCTFRHSTTHHCVVFHTVAKLVALSIKSDELLFNLQKIDSSQLVFSKFLIKKVFVINSMFLLSS